MLQDAETGKLIVMLLLAISFGSFPDRLPPWGLGVVGLIMMPSLAITLVGMAIWFPRCLLPGWYKRARKAGVPCQDVHAMASFKRLSKVQQRTWPDLPERG